MYDRQTARVRPTRKDCAGDLNAIKFERYSESSRRTETGVVVFINSKFVFVEPRNGSEFASDYR